MVKAKTTKKYIQDSPDLQKLRLKRKKAQERMIIFIAVLFVLALIGLVVLARTPKAQITKITVTGNHVVQAQDVIDHASRFLSGNYFYLIPRSNDLLYPRKSIIGDLVDSYPRFRSVQVYRTSNDTININVEEVRGYALWCGMDSLRSDAPCYFTDDSGRVIDTAPNFSGNVYPRFFGSNLITDGADPFGKYIVESDKFTKLVAFSKKVTDLNLPVKGTVINGNNEYSFIIDLGAGKMAMVRFMPDDDYAILASNLTLALAKDALAKQMSTDKANLQYFDLRFTNKVYYKFSDK